MTISYMTKAELDTNLGTANIDASVKADVLNYLTTAGVYPAADPSKEAWVQQGTYTSPTASIVQVLDITTSGTFSVNTDPALSAIILQTPGPSQLFVTDDGTHFNNVYVALGTGADSVNLFDGGNDTVQGGNGGDVIGGGIGNDLLIGGTGNDSLYGGPGANTLIGGDGDNYIRVAGAHSLGEGGGSGNNLIEDLGGYAGAGTSTLMAGTGSDTIWGFGGDLVEGDSLAAGTGVSVLHGGTTSTVLSNSAAGTYNILGSGSTGPLNGDSMVGGHGADSLYGGGGQDTLVAGDGDNQALVAGTGAHQSLVGGLGNNDYLSDSQSGGTDTLTAGGGTNQNLFGQQGDTFATAAGSTTGATFWVNAGSGAGSSLTGGAGDDVFHIETKVGNDTITGGGGTDIAAFAGRTEGDMSSLTGSAGNFELTFTGGQTIDLHGVSEIFFGDDGQTINLPH